MKKFTKGMLIVAGIFGAVGIGLTAAGGVMGASMSELTQINRLKKAFDFDEVMVNWKFNDDGNDYDEADVREDDVGYDIAGYDRVNIKRNDPSEAVIAYMDKTI